jgi:phosphatidylserine/phosphatidylglycerophosphate/cardiolipin synthase-like enzyme
MKTLFVVLFFCVLLAAFLIIVGIRMNSGSETILPRPLGQLSTIVLPDDGMTPVVRMIQSASSSVDLVMYELQDPIIESALAVDTKRGVAVRVLLDHGYYGVPSKSNINEAVYEYLIANHVSVEWTPTTFALTHQKTLITDRREALVMSFNLVAQYYPTGRDFGIVDHDPADVAAIEATFNADWRRKDIAPSIGDGLVWSPGSEDAMVEIIKNAKKSLDIYNEEMVDDAVENALQAAAQHGVAVRIIMTYSSEWKRAFGELKSAGVEIRTYPATKAALYIHAKMILVDDTSAFVGSENFSAASLYNNRELGITFTDPVAITPLARTFNADWQNAESFK